ncbi:MAG: T9SS type A sorting domain-containing protein [Fimbriimonadaceae bacterium]|nr:T9SS type A sorting domain-containing protein [Chitinophagales bacterium]
MHKNLSILTGIFLIIYSINIPAQSDVLDLGFSDEGKFVHSLPHNYSGLLPDDRLIFINSDNNFPDSVLMLLDDGFIDESFGIEGINRFEDFPYPDGQTYEYKYTSAAIITNEGKFLVAGYAVYDIGSDYFIARYNTDATLDETFGDAGVIWGFGEVSSYEEVEQMFVDANEKIVFTNASYGYDEYYYISRLLDNGSPDSTFDDDGTYSMIDLSFFCKKIIEDDDNRLYLAGKINETFSVIRFLEDGQPDFDFGSFGIATIPVESSEAQDIYFNAPYILVSGMQYIHHLGEFEKNMIITRFFTDGDPDMSFFDDGFEIIELESVTPYNEFGVPASVINTNGDMYFGVSHGLNIPADSTAAFSIIKYDENGNISTAFSVDGKTMVLFDEFDFGHVNKLIIDNSGKLLCSGIVYNDENSTFAFRLHIDGTITGTDTVIASAFELSNNTVPIHIFPNPAFESFSIHVQPESLISNLTIFNLVGKKVYNVSNVYVKEMIDVSNYAAGIYFVLVEITEQQNSLKLVVE